MNGKVLLFIFFIHLNFIIMKNFARLLSVFLCIFLTGCKEPTMTEKEKNIYELFLKKEEEKAIENLISWIKSDSRTFDYNFPYLQNKFLQIIESEDKVVKQYNICYTIDQKKIFGKNIVQYKTDKGNIKFWEGSLRCLVDSKDSEFNFDGNGLSIITVPRQDSPLYLLLSLECEYPPYSYATVTPFERRGENLVYVENIFPTNVSFEFDGTYNPKETFDHIFLFTDIDNSLYIQNKNIYNQLIDSYTHYQWNGEKFTIVNP